MRVVDRLARREATWQELDRLLIRLEGTRAARVKRPRAPKRPPRVDGEVVWVDEADLHDDTPEPRVEAQAAAPRRGFRVGTDEVLRLGELYRAACADLMLAEAYDLPRDTVAYLHDLVARAHNAIYRSRGFRFRDWAGEVLAEVPRRLRSDPFLRASALIFYGCFALFLLLSVARPELARRFLGEAQLDQMEQSFADSPGSKDYGGNNVAMVGFYVRNNAGIGLQCYAWGMSLGIGTLYIVTSNGVIIGLQFGHMIRSPNAGNFLNFVTAHAPFELTAIVLAGAAGMRLGYGLIDTQGQTRQASLRREAKLTLPTAGAATFLFFLAAFLEALVSGSPLPYPAKATISILCAGVLLFYLIFGGRSRERAAAAGIAPHGPGGA